MLSSTDDIFYCVLSQFLSLIIWLWKREQSPAVDLSGKEALNFHITALIALTGLSILDMIPLIGCLTIPITFVVVLGAMVLSIVAALKASDGYFYRYPVNLRLIK